MRIVAEPQLTVVAFRAQPPDLSPGDWNAFNRRWLAAVNDRRRVYMTGTLLDGEFVLRICVLSFRTHLDRMELAMADLESTLGECLASLG